MADEEKNDIDTSELDPAISVENERIIIEENEKQQKADTEKSTDDMPEETEKSESFMTKVKNFISGKDNSEDSAKDIVEDIPDEFTEAALKVGWTEEQIIQFAAEVDEDGEFVYSPEDLKEMSNYLAEEIEETEVKTEVKKEEKIEVKDTKKDETKKDEDSKIAELTKKIEALEKAQAKASEDDKVSEATELSRQVTGFFDKVSESFPIFGKTKDMKKFPNGRLVPTTKEYKAREEVLADALMFRDAGLSVGIALEKALSLYKGNHLEKDLERKVIKKLKDDEQKLSPQRYNRATEPVFKDEIERQEEVVRLAARKANLKKFD